MTRTGCWRRPPSFDDPPTAEWTRQFLARAGHHLLVAVVDGTDVGTSSAPQVLVEWTFGS